MIKGKVKQICMILALVGLLTGCGSQSKVPDDYATNEGYQTEKADAKSDTETNTAETTAAAAGIAKEDISTNPLKYVTNYEVMDDNLFKEKMKELYKKSLQKEIRNGSTLIGPHRDDLEFYINDDNIKSLGSQGQKRMAVLSLKLAEIEIFKKYAKTNPILLLDDVFSELDITKRNKLLTYINKNIQTIITTTDLKNLSEKLINNGKIFYIKEGNIVKEK